MRKGLAFRALVLLVLVACAAPVQGAGQTPARLARPATPPGTAIGNTLTMEVTAYCPCTICCGHNARGITASGQPASYHNRTFVAADASLLPFYSQVIVPGYNHDKPVPVIDRGSAITGHRLDIFFPNHAQAQRWGRQTLLVKIVSVSDVQ
jgi:3D (Asp-Asp-Asp) domain-containing protein